MRLSKSVSANATSLYVIKSVTIDGKRTSKVVEKLGTVKELEEKLNGQDPIKWAEEYVKTLNEQEAAGKLDITANFSPSKTIPKNEGVLFEGGYLFLKYIYHQLKLDDICEEITKKKKLKYDLDSILSRLIYTRIMFPSSKLSSYKVSKNFLEAPSFELHQVYRALDTLAEFSDFIKSEVYSKSLNVVDRNTNLLYYDCTNYYFEIGKEDNLREHLIDEQSFNLSQSSPLVQMGLLMDGNGIPLSFVINPGNTNEQLLKAIEERILEDFKLSNFIICTDAGLSSLENDKFYNLENKAYVTTQSVIKLEKHLQEWA